MKIKSIKLVYFSPTGTTRKVVQTLANNIGLSQMEYIDLSLPGIRKKGLNTSGEELLIIGVPVYMGRVPALLSDWFQKIKAEDTPTVCVVVYGNRAFDNALLELRDIVTQKGCKPIAGAAFIGEHSFSGNGLHIAQGRPDTKDLKHLKNFGKGIAEKIINLSAQDQTKLYVPGAYPFGGVMELWNVDFIDVNRDCSQCGLCAEKCPMEAIKPLDSADVDIVACISCCACIKSCPQNARSIKSGPVKDAAKRLFTLYNERKEPEYFL